MSFINGANLPQSQIDTGSRSCINEPTTPSQFQYLRSMGPPKGPKAGLFLSAPGLCLSDGEGKKTEKKGGRKKKLRLMGLRKNSHEEKETARTQDLRERLFLSTSS